MEGAILDTVNAEVVAIMINYREIVRSVEVVEVEEDLERLEG